MKGKFSLAVVVCLFLVFTTKAQNSLFVNETESSVVLNERTANVLIVVENPSETFDGKIRLELLDTENKVRAQTAQNLRIKKGRETYKIPLPVGDLLTAAEDEIAWFRLRYSVGEKSGIISLSELIKDIFELRIAASEQVFSGMNYRVRVRAVQPFTKVPVKNVKIEGGLELELDTEADEDELILKAKGETDGEGFAVLDFKIPADVKLDGDGDLKIVGRKNGIVREIDEDLDADENKGFVLLTTDKPLYQPGQDFKVRGLYLDANNTVVTNSELEFKIYDEDDTVLYKETLMTSAFGIASLAWKIPENAKLGTYRIEIENDNSDNLGSQDFKVSRYDLPNFSVTAKPDKTFYLPTDKQAEIAVTADYLFGKPVTKGKVRVVQEGERRWNYREQKYDITEKGVFEGAADADGKYIAKVDLSEEIADLRSSSWRRYEDLNFAAYYTDVSTNKTEQRRFDIRLTKEPIHIYLIRHADNNPNLPIATYISTFYADGTPAICNVEVQGEEKPIARFKTNSFGAGKMEFNIPKDDADETHYDLKITARDQTGQTGTFEEEFYLDKDDAVKIELEKTIFKAGESVKINLLSTQKDGFLYVDVVKDWTVIDSYLVNLENGKADLKIPYHPNFKGELTIAAYSDDNENYWDERMRASRGIIFPARQNLKLDANFEKTVFSPNEEATVKFSVSDGIGKAVESALGVVVFDKAIEERARTDAEFGSYFSRYFGLLGYSKSFGGVTLKDLNELNPSKPISDEMQLVAEIMLANNYFYPRIYRSNFNQTEAKSLYAEFFKKQFAPVEEVLKKQYEKTAAHPTDENSLRKILNENDINFDDLRDPWQMNYRAKYEVAESNNIVNIESAGADKKFATNDDFTVLKMSFAYFLPVGKTIDKANLEYNGRTGRFIRDYAVLRDELKKYGVDLDNLKDRWNRPYKIRFGINQHKFIIVFHSNGENGIYQPSDWDKDDFDVWTSEIDYFTDTEQKIQKILSSSTSEKKMFPQTEAEFKKILQASKIDFAQIKDGYGQNTYLTINAYSRYSDKVKIENSAKFGEVAVTQKMTIEPVTQQVITLKIRSRGADFKEGTSDDFDLAAFSGVVSEQSKSDAKPLANISITATTGAAGAVRGTITDPNGAVVPNATVTATNNETEEEFSAASNDEGVYLIENLPAGKYKISAEAVGFNSTVLSDVPVRAQTLTEANLTLNIGGVSATVEVTSGVATLETTSTAIGYGEGSGTGDGNGGGGGGKSKKNVSENQIEKSTPRLREYFPKTLVWSPELITDKNGKAELKFKMADTITTWKLYTIASTKNGKIGVAEKEIQAFQPFFVDLEPPKFLTEGDEIYLPTQVRNYTEKKQKVDVSMAKGDWFSFLNSEKQQIEVAPNASENAIFGFKADAVIKGGKQRVTAIAAKDSDAIEKSVTVRPNGQEIVKTESRLFNNSANFDVNFPANALAQTQKAEVKIYPNLFSHVAESVEGLLQRPYGCGEQTISSTYPNLMILKFSDTETRGRGDAEKKESLAASPRRRVSASVEEKAKKYLQKGYERLLGYQVADGGFSYWGGKDAADIALTAYAIRFLNDAKSFIAVDEDVIKRAQTWLISQQRADGSWTRKYSWENSEDASRTKLFTSYVARTLAMSKEKNDIVLQKALAYLKQRNAEIDEPYALALFGLALLDAGNLDDAAAIAGTLEKMAISEGDSVYWKLETNTPFYGWGIAGRIETTALVLQLLVNLNRRDAETLIKNKENNSASPRLGGEKDLISRATMFLLKNKDRYGVWCSTQTTINVLDAFLATLKSEPEAVAMGQNQSIQILLNNENLQTVEVSTDQITPIILDLTGKLNAAANNLEIKSSVNSAVMSQIVQTHYIDWRDAEISNQTTNGSRQIRLDYKCDKLNAEIMQDVTCSVETERVGFKGYGMLLAEIGLPPGADVSRESLQAAMDADWSLSRYDVLPDRIVIYIWSKAGGTKFNFKFKPRYGINAQTPASIVYDYYNEEAKATVAPMKFLIK